MNKLNTMMEKCPGFIAEARGAKTSFSRMIVTARFTSDEEGETLSLEAGGVQITIPYEPVKKLIDRTRKSSKKEG